MADLKEKLSDFGTGVLVVLMASLTGMGIYHSATKHSDVFASVFFPPWAWYRGAELLWHDDYAGVDWELRMNNDSETSFYLLDLATTGDVNPIEWGNDFEVFKRRISAYPLDKYETLRANTKLYIVYTFEIAELMENMITQISKGEQPDWIPTKSLIKAQIGLESIGFAQKVQAHELYFQTLISNMDPDTYGEEVDKEQLEMLDNVRQALTIMKSEYIKNYEALFNEPFPLNN